jgi:hypothetical protein
MSSAAPIFSHFDGGEVSPLFAGRVDSERYKSSLALCKNFLPTIQGGLAKRSGSYHVGSVKNSANKSRLIPFIYSSTQAYALEFGANYIRFWANYGEVQSGGSALELATPYGQSDIAGIKWVQSADVLYLFHPSYAPRKLLRFSSTSWQLATITFQDGPFLAPKALGSTSYGLSDLGGIGVDASYNAAVSIGGTSSVRGAANNGSGVIRIAVDSTSIYQSGDRLWITSVGGTTEANGVWTINVIDSQHFDLLGSTFVHAYTASGFVNHAVFDSSDVGRLFRAKKVAGNWAWGVITGYTDAYRATVKFSDNKVFDAAGSYSFDSYALGVYSTGNGYPSTASFHEDRLCLSGCAAYPQRIDMSKSSDYENFSPTAPDGTVANNNGVSFSLNATDVNLIEWLSSDEKGLLAGTTSAEWIVRPSVFSEAISPTNISAKKSTSWGSSSLSPVRVGKAAVFVQRGLRKIREVMYFYDIDGYRATDLTELAEHITGTGLVEAVYQSLPISTVWALRSDGALIATLYERELGQLRVGTSQHAIGGVSDAAGSPAVVESICSIPSPDGSQDDLWMIVQRYVNGSVVRHIEFLEKISEDIDDPYSLGLEMMVDAGLTLNSPLSITGASFNGTTVVLTIPSHGLSTSNAIKVTGVKGFLLAGVSVLNGNSYLVTVTDSNHVTLTDLAGANINATGVTSYVSGGEARKKVTTVSGLSHLEGETVDALCDGTPVSGLVVSSGSVTLPSASAVVSIGYGFNADGQTLRLDAGARNGTSLGKTRRIQRIGVLMHASQAFQVGRSFTKLDRLSFRDTESPSATKYSGIVSQEMDFNYDFDNQICFRADKPLRCVIQAIMPMVQTQDRA